MEKWSQARITNLTSLSQNICSETQFKIQHINHEMKKKGYNPYM